MFESRSWRGILDTTLCNTVCQWFAAGQLFSSITPVCPTNKTHRHDIIELLLKVALNTISLSPLLQFFYFILELFRQCSILLCLSFYSNVHSYTSLSNQEELRHMTRLHLITWCITVDLITWCIIYSGFVIDWLLGDSLGSDKIRRIVASMLDLFSGYLVTVEVLI